MQRKINISDLLLNLTIFMFIVDCENSIFGIKYLSFFLFLLYSCINGNYKKIILIVFIYLIPIISLLINTIVPNNTISTKECFAVFKTFSLLILLAWTEKDSKLQFFKYFYKAIYFFAFLIDILALILLSSQVLYLGFYYLLYFGPLKNTLGQMINFPIEMRHFIGLNFIMVYTRVAVLGTFSYAYSMYQYLILRRKEFFMPVIVFFFFLIFSGTRALILSSLLITGTSIIYRLYKKKRIILLIICLILGIIAASIILYKVFTQKNDNSMEIKALHIKSYMMLFQSDPIRFLLFGDGPGAFFYSMGRNKELSHTELSYYDLVHYFGLIPTVIFLFILLYPMLLILHNRAKTYGFLFAIAYIAFLFVAGTNPLLLNSTGMLAYIMMWYVTNHDITNEVDRIQKSNFKGGVILKWFLH